MLQFQKLTRNLFLTLHGQNLHRQQRQLSKFLMRYQQFARSYRMINDCGLDTEKEWERTRWEIKRKKIKYERYSQEEGINDFLSRFWKDMRDLQ